MIKLDGNYGEGGGAITRVALAMSTLTGKAFEVDNIRKGRPNPGLKAQHLCAIEGVKKLCNAKVEGNFLKSEYLKYEPKNIEGKTISLEIGTAGSTSLVLQSLLLPSMFADKKVRIKLTGATSGKWAMPFDFFKEIFIPQIRKFCDKIDVELIRRGYYPKGGGKIEVKIRPKYKLSDFNSFNEFLEHIRKESKKIDLLEQGYLIQVKGVSHASYDLQKAEVAERQAKAAKLILSKLNVPIQIRTEYANTDSTGSGITLWVIFSTDKEEIDFDNPIRIGADSLGEKGKRAEEVGKEAAERLIKEINYKAPVDKYLADNLIPFIALFGKQIKVSQITNHCLTNIYVVEQFLGKIFDVDKENSIIIIKN